MAMTAAVKDELSRVAVSKRAAGKAEVSALLRFAGGLHIVAGRVVVEAELDTGSVARRLRREIGELYGHAREVHVLAAGGLRKGTRYVVRVVARRRGRWPGRPACSTHAADRCAACRRRSSSGGVSDAEAAWRGAFLAHGSLTEPGRSASLEVTCPGPEAALALVGAARRLGIAAKAREVRGADRVRGPGRRRHRRAAHPAGRPHVDAGLGGAADAPRGPGDREPAGQLRRRQPAPLGAGGGRRRGAGRPGAGHPRRRGARRTCSPPGACGSSTTQASLEELGQLADPPMTKDAVAGRIRRLLHMADKRAADLGIPDTESAVTADMLEEA